MSRPRIHQDVSQTADQKSEQKNLKINHKATMQQSKKMSSYFLLYKRRRDPWSRLKSE